MTTFRSLFWNDDDGQLKTFSASTRSGAISVVKIEIEVRDPFRLAALLRDLEDIRLAQTAVDREAAAPKRRASRRRAIDSKPAPLLLTYREDE